MNVPMRTWGSPGGWMGGGTYLGVLVGFQYLQKRYCPSALTR